MKRYSTTKGFSRASGLMQARIAKASEGRGFAMSRLLTHWAEIVGPDLARMAEPVKVGYGRGGLGATLTVLCSGAQAPLVEMQKERIRERVNACYGYNAIARLRITQTAASGVMPGAAGFAEGQTPFAGPNAGAERPADPRPAPVTPEARTAASGVQDDGLRAALEQLAANVQRKSRSNRSFL